MRFRSATALIVTIPLALGLATAGEAQAFSASSPKGVDVSKWQHPGAVKLDWEKVADNGEKFAFIKATDGKEGESGYFVEDSTAAAKAGLIIGSYHKAHPDLPATKQADDYAAALAKLPADAAKLPPVLDIELDNGLNTAQLQDWTDTFLKRVKEKTGQTPMIYTYRWFWQSPMGNTTKFKDYPLWLAAYQSTPPSSIGGWDAPTFWQHSSTGKVPGIPMAVDQNYFNGSEAELNNFVTGTPVRTSSSATETKASPSSSESSTPATTTPEATSPASTTSVEEPALKSAADGIAARSAESAQSTKSSSTTKSSAATEPTSAESTSAESTPATAEPMPDAAQPASPELMQIIQKWVDGVLGNQQFAKDAQQQGMSKDSTDLLVALLEQVKMLGNSVDKQQLQQMDDATANADTTGTTKGGAPAASTVTISDIIALVAAATR